jgi:hypothetical protein
MSAEHTDAPQQADRDATRALEEELRRSAALFRSLADRLAARRQGEATDVGAGDLPEPCEFTYVEFIEFATAREFRRFKYLPPVSKGEIEAADLDALAAALQQV